MKFARCALFLAFMTIFASSLMAQNWFRTPLIVSGGKSMVHVADADGDGDSDVLAITLGAASMRYLYNDGNGVFSPGPLSPLHPDTIDPFQTYRRRELADFNDDGILDALFFSSAGPGASSLDFYFGQGGGLFAAPVRVTVNDLREFAAGNFNGDSQTDLIVISGPFFDPITVRWLSWNGSQFQFTPSVSLAPDRLFSVTEAMDLDGDFNDEILVVSFAAAGIVDDEIAVVRVVAGQLVVSDILSVPQSFASTHLTPADIDLDGDQDMVVMQANSGYSANIYTLLNHSDGTLNIGPSSSFSDIQQRLSLSGIQATDWDNDGDLDLINQEILTFAGDLSMAILENDGNHVFTEAFSTKTYEGGECAGVADLDQDGFVDFIGSGALYFGDGTFDPVSTSFSGSETLVDWEGDGDTDSVNQDSARVNDGTGQFDRVDFTFPPAGSDPSIIFGSATGIGDFNGDGFDDQLRPRLEIINERPFETQFIEMVLLVDDGSGTNFVEQGLATPDDEISGIGRSFAIDLDQDNDIDILTNDGLWTNDGVGFFSTHQDIFPIGDLQDHIDVDGDGDLDFLLLISGGALVLQRNQGGLQFSPEVLLIDVDLGDGAQFVDLDMDGDFDVAVGRVDSPNNGTFVFENIGGVLGAGTFLGTVDNRQGSDRHAASDVDGDGLSDLLVTEAEGNVSDFLVYRRIGPGLTYEVAKHWIGFGSRGFADIDEDGDLDIAGRVITSSKFRGPGIGVVRQYGEGTPGTGNAIPVLGASGPTRPGSPYSIRLRRAVGGTIGLFVVGLNESDIQNSPFPGLTSYAEPWLFFFILPIGGTPGSPGQGQFTIDFTVDPALSGMTFFHQMFFLDAGGAFGKTASNGLEIEYGL